MSESDLPAVKSPETKALPPPVTSAKPTEFAYSGESDKWPAKKKREYNAQIHEAYQDAFDEADPTVQCENSKGSVMSSCECQHCTGARASAAKAKELTGYDPALEKPTRG